ncbi:TPA: sodium:calcium antiporter [Candidatus Woesearchaeota archaeon]|nr:sodium:calcium antiporter [Candidatus Woesearchaeota archaeon]HII66038.1 sodium:calcium antiporter [Candidatus Woesearchaeota archaeon]
MTLLVDIAFFFASLVMLVVSASFMVKYLARIAAYLRMSEFVISFIIIGLSTSIPELFIGITSAMAGNPQLSLGNLIGSNIADLTTVIGIPVLLARGIRISTRAAQDDVYYMFAIAALPLVLMALGGELSRIDGLILIGVFIVYMYNLVRQQRTLHKRVEETVGRMEIVSAVFLFIACLALVLGSAYFVVKHASSLALGLNLPLILVGVVLLGLGTSLPELSFNIRSVRQGHPEMALGDSVGSVVVNSSLVLGIVALIHPIQEALFLYLTAWIFMLLVGFIFLTFVKSGNKLNWQEGLALIMLYSFFLMVEFYVKGTV